MTPNHSLMIIVLVVAIAGWLAAYSGAISP
jgi:hypothetical protein